MHAFEDHISRGGHEEFSGFPIVKVDPGGRCAIMVIHRHKLVVIPLVREHAARGDLFSASAAATESEPETAAPGLGGSVGPAVVGHVASAAGAAVAGGGAVVDDDQQSHSVFRSFVINCEEMNPPIRRIHDFVLLEGFYQPTVRVSLLWLWYTLRLAYVGHCCLAVSDRVLLIDSHTLASAHACSRVRGRFLAVTTASSHHLLAHHVSRGTVSCGCRSGNRCAVAVRATNAKDVLPRTPVCSQLTHLPSPRYFVQVVVLHEPMPTWAGRHAVTRDTKALAQLSLDLADQRHSVRRACFSCAPFLRGVYCVAFSVSFCCASVLGAW